MFNSKNTRLLALFAMIGTLNAASALADEDRTQPTPRRDDIIGECRFEGVFDTGKGGSFMSACQARFAFPVESMKNGNPGQREEFLRLVCDDRLIYEDGLRVRVIPEPDHDFDLIVSGIHGNPRIVIEEVTPQSINDGRLDATLQYQANGFSYTLHGHCRLRQQPHPAFQAELR